MKITAIKPFVLDAGIYVKVETDANIYGIGEAGMSLRGRAVAEVVNMMAPILVGEDPGSVKYVAGKHADCAEVGILSIREDLPATATQAEVAAAVDRLNADDACTGYIVQLPLPAGVDTRTPSQIISWIRTRPSSLIRNLAASRVWRKSETSFIASAWRVLP